MSLTSDIEKELKRLNTALTENNRVLALSHAESYIYAKDIKSNEEYINKAKAHINNLKDAIGYLQNKISNHTKTGFCNTYKALKKVNNDIGEDELSNVISVLNEKSRETYTEFKSKYDDNINAINTLISNIQDNLDFMERNDSKIDELNKQKNNSEITEEELKEINNDIDKYENKNSKKYNTCLEYIKDIDSKLEENKQILEGGLKKAVSAGSGGGSSQISYIAKL